MKKAIRIEKEECPQSTVSGLDVTVYGWSGLKNLGLCHL